VAEKFMPTDLIHRIGIAGRAEMVYRAITTQDGIRAWWTTDVKLDAHVGGKSVFSFFDGSTTFEMRIEELKPPSFVRWRCTGGTSPDWVGTTQEFVLTPQPDGEMLLKFCHGGWERGGDHYYFCNTTWGHLLVCLKDYCEHGVKNPYFT
jgi:uncharacterized protein YndB with AHSA1/START domain